MHSRCSRKQPRSTRKSTSQTNSKSTHLTQHHTKSPTQSPHNSTACSIQSIAQNSQPSLFSSSSSPVPNHTNSPPILTDSFPTHKNHTLLVSTIPTSSKFHFSHIRTTLLNFRAITVVSCNTRIYLQNRNTLLRLQNRIFSNAALSFSTSSSTPQISSISSNSTETSLQPEKDQQTQEDTLESTQKSESEKSEFAAVLKNISKKYSQVLHSLQNNYKLKGFSHKSSISRDSTHELKEQSNHIYTQTNFASFNKVDSQTATFPLTNSSSPQTPSSLSSSSSSSSSLSSSTPTTSTETLDYVNPLGSSSFMGRRAQATREANSLRSSQSDSISPSLNQQTAQNKLNDLTKHSIGNQFAAVGTSNHDQPFQPFEQFPRSPLFSFTQYNNAVISPHALPSLSQHKELAGDIIQRHKDLQHEYEIIKEESMHGKKHLRDIEKSAFNELIAMQFVFDELMEEFPNGMNTLMDIQALEHLEGIQEKDNNFRYTTPNSKHTLSSKTTNINANSTHSATLTPPQGDPETTQDLDTTLPLFEPNQLPVYNRLWSPTALARHSEKPITSGPLLPPTIHSIHTKFISLLPHTSTFKPPSSLFDISSVLISLLHQNKIVTSRQQVASVYLSFLKHHHPEVSGTLYGSLVTGVSTPDADCDISLSGITPSSPLNTPDILFRPMRLKLLIKQLDDSGLPSLNWDQINTSSRQRFNQKSFDNHHSQSGVGVQSQYQQYLTDFNNNIDRFTLHHFNLDHSFIMTEIKRLLPDYLDFIPNISDGSGGNTLDGEDPDGFNEKANQVQDPLGFLPSSWSGEVTIDVAEITPVDKLYSKIHSNTPAAVHHLTRLIQDQLNKTYLQDIDNSLVFFDQTRSNETLLSSSIHSPDFLQSYRKNSIDTKFDAQLLNDPNTPKFSSKSQSTLYKSNFLSHLYQVTPNQKHLLRRHELFAYSALNSRGSGIPSVFLPPPSVDYQIGSKFPSRFAQIEVEEDDTTTSITDQRTEKDKKKKLITLFTPLSPFTHSTTSSQLSNKHITPFEFGDTLSTTGEFNPTTHLSSENSDINVETPSSAMPATSNNSSVAPSYSKLWEIPYLPRLYTRLKRINPQFLAVSTQWQIESYSHQSQKQTRFNQENLKRDKKHLFSSSSQNTSIDGLYNLTIDPIIQSPYRFYSLQSFIELQKNIQHRLKFIRSKKNSRSSSITSSLSREFDFFLQKMPPVSSLTSLSNSTPSPLLSPTQYTQYQQSPLTLQLLHQSTTPSGWDLDVDTNPRTISISLQSPFYLSHSHPRDLEPNIHSFIADTQTQLKSLLSNNGFDTSPTNGDPKRMRNAILKLVFKKSLVTQNPVYNSFRTRQTRPDISTLTKPNPLDWTHPQPTAVHFFIVLQDYYTSIFRNWFHNYTTLGKTQSGLKILHQYQQRYFNHKRHDLRLGHAKAQTSIVLNFPSSSHLIDHLSTQPPINTLIESFQTTSESEGSQSTLPNQDPWFAFTKQLSSLFPSSVHSTAKVKSPYTTNSPNLSAGEFYPLSTLPPSICYTTEAEASEKHVFQFPTHPMQPIISSPVSFTQPLDFTSKFDIDFSYRDSLINLNQFHLDLQQAHLSSSRPTPTPSPPTTTDSSIDPSSSIQPLQFFSPTSAYSLHIDKLLTRLEQHPRLNPFFSLRVPTCPLIHPNHEPTFSLAFPPPTISDSDHFTNTLAKNFHNSRYQRNNPFFQLPSNILGSMVHHNPLISTKLTWNNSLISPNALTTGLTYPGEQLSSTLTDYFYEPFAALFSHQTRVMQAIRRIQSSPRSNKQSKSTTDSISDFELENVELENDQLSFLDEIPHITQEQPPALDETQTGPLSFPVKTNHGINTSKDSIPHEDLYPTTATSHNRFQYFSLPACSHTFSHQSLWTAIKYVTYCLLIKEGGIAQSSALTISGISQVQAEAIQSWLYPRAPNQHNNNLLPSNPKSLPNIDTDDSFITPPVESEYVNFLRNDDMLQISDPMLFYPKRPSFTLSTSLYPIFSTHSADRPLIHTLQEQSQPHSLSQLEPEFFLPLRPVEKLSSNLFSVPGVASLPASINFIPKLFASDIITKVNSHYEAIDELNKQANFVQHHIKNSALSRSRTKLMIDYLSNQHIPPSRDLSLPKQFISSILSHYTDLVSKYKSQQKDGTFAYEVPSQASSALGQQLIQLGIQLDQGDPNSLPTYEFDPASLYPVQVTHIDELQTHIETEQNQLEDKFVAGIKDTVRLMAKQTAVYTYDPFSSNSSTAETSHPDNANDQMDFDLSFNNNIGIVNSALIREYVAIDPRVQPLILLVKQWAKSTQLHGATNQNLSSYAFTVLSLFYLQQTDILPNLQRYFTVVEDYDRASNGTNGPTIYPIPPHDIDVAFDPTSYSKDSSNKPHDLFDFLTYLQKVRGQSAVNPSSGTNSDPPSAINEHTVNTKSVQWILHNNYNGFALSDDFIGYGCRHEHLRKMSLHELFTGFLKYYSHFDFTKFVVSLSEGQPISKEYKNTYSWPSLHQHRLRGNGWNSEFRSDSSSKSNKADNFTKYQSKIFSQEKKKYMDAKNSPNINTTLSSSSMDDIDQDDYNDTNNLNDDNLLQLGHRDPPNNALAIPNLHLHHHHPPGSRSVGEIAENSESYSEDYTTDELTSGSNQNEFQDDDFSQHFSSNEHLEQYQVAMKSLIEQFSTSVLSNIKSTSSSSHVDQHDSTLVDSAKLFLGLSQTQNDHQIDWALPTYKIHDGIEGSPFHRYQNLNSVKLLQFQFDQWMSLQYQKLHNMRYRSEKQQNTGILTKLQLEQIQNHFSYEFKTWIGPEQVRTMESSGSRFVSNRGSKLTSDGYYHRSSHREHASGFSLPDTYGLSASKFQKGIFSRPDDSHRSAQLISNGETYEYTSFTSNLSQGSLLLRISDLIYQKHHNPWNFLSIEDPVDLTHDLSRTCSSHFAIAFTSQCEQSRNVYISPRFVSRLRKYQSDIQSTSSDIDTIQHQLSNERNKMENKLRGGYTSLVKELWTIQSDMENETISLFESKSTLDPSLDPPTSKSKSTLSPTEQLQYPLPSSTTANESHTPATIQNTNVTTILSDHLDSATLSPTQLALTTFQLSNDKQSDQIHQHFTDHMHNVIQQSTAQFKMYDSSYFSTLETYKPDHDHIQSTIPTSSHHTSNPSNNSTVSISIQGTIDYRTSQPIPSYQTSFEAIIRKYPIPSVQKVLLAVLQLGLSGSTDFTSNPMFNHQLRGKLGKDFYSNTLENNLGPPPRPKLAQNLPPLPIISKTSSTQHSSSTSPQQLKEDLPSTKHSSIDSSVSPLKIHSYSSKQKTVTTQMPSQIAQSQLSSQNVFSKPTEISQDRVRSSQSLAASSQPLSAASSPSSIPDDFPSVTTVQSIENSSQITNTSAQIRQEVMKAPQKQILFMPIDFSDDEFVDADDINTLKQLGIPIVSSEAMKSIPEVSLPSSTFKFPPGTSGQVTYREKHTTQAINNENHTTISTIATKITTTVTTKRKNADSSAKPTISTHKLSPHDQRGSESSSKSSQLSESSSKSAAKLLSALQDNTTLHRSSHQHQHKNRQDIKRHDLFQPTRDQLQTEQNKSAKQHVPLSKQFADQAQRSAERIKSFKKDIQAFEKQMGALLTSNDINLGPVDGSINISKTKTKGQKKVVKVKPAKDEYTLEPNDKMIQHLAAQLLRDDASNPLKIFNLQAFEPVIKKMIQGENQDQSTRANKNTNQSNTNQSSSGPQPKSKSTNSDSTLFQHGKQSSKSTQTSADHSTPSRRKK